jgi:hypothetical protein
MIEKTTRDALFKEIHKAINQATESLVTQFQGADLSYPPGVELNQDETVALSSLQLSEPAKSGLRKLVADACSYPVFHFFSLLDGVTDPDADLGHVWLGATISEKLEEDKPMLHDELHESYWLYKEE